MSGATRQDVQQFVRVSSALTGFSSFELFGTGQAPAYYEWVNEVAPVALRGIMDALSDLPDGEEARAQVIRARVMSVPALGDTARAIIKLWYLGQWEGDSNTTILSADAYKEGLVWKAIGAHPQAAKEQGFGAWAFPPRDILPDR